MRRFPFFETLDDWMLSTRWLSYSDDTERPVLCRLFSDLEKIVPSGRSGVSVKYFEAVLAEVPSVQGVRPEALISLRDFLYRRWRVHFAYPRIPLIYDPAHTTWSVVHDLLCEAVDLGKAGPVAQYLVGAKLELRFHDVKVSNDNYSAADVQTGRPGDFLVGDTAFHVTVAPNLAVFEKCKRNLEAGVRVYLLVPDDRVVGSRQNAEETAPARIAVESIESFIANNIEELSTFGKGSLVSGFRRLLETYNRRVAEVETDKSMLIEIPSNLR